MLLNTKAPCYFQISLIFVTVLTSRTFSTLAAKSYTLGPLCCKPNPLRALSPFLQSCSLSPQLSTSPNPTVHPSSFPTDHPFLKKKKSQSQPPPSVRVCVSQRPDKALVFLRPPISVCRRPPGGVNPLQPMSYRQYVQSPSPCPDSPIQEDTVSNSLSI